MGQRFLVDLTVVSYLQQWESWTCWQMDARFHPDSNESGLLQYQSFIWIKVYQNLIRGQHILQLFKCCLFLVSPLPGCCLLCRVERLCHDGQVRDELPVELY